MMFDKETKMFKTLIAATLALSVTVSAAHAEGGERYHHRQFNGGQSDNGGALIGGLIGGMILGGMLNQQRQYPQRQYMPAPMYNDPMYDEDQYVTRCRWVLIQDVYGREYSRKVCRNEFGQ
jgi:hypothetical protein